MTDAHSRFRTLLAARSISTLCTGMNTVVSAWLVLAIGGSVLNLAILASLNAGVGIPAVFFGGPLVDRFSRRNVALATELGRIVPVGLIPVLAALGRLELWHVLVASACVSALHAVSVAAYGAMLPELLDRDEMVRANGLWQAVSQVGVFTGAALGGAAIPVLGDANALLLEVAGRVLAGIGLLALAWHPSIRPTAGSRGVLLRDMAAAWSMLRRRRALLWVTLFAGVPGSLIWGVNAVLPAFVKNENGMGATAYGLVDAAWGAGAFIVGLLCARLPARRQNHRYRIGSLLLTGGTLMAFALASDLLSAIALAAAVGGVSLGCLVLFQSYVQAESPEGYTGRILAMSQLVLSALWLTAALGVGVLTLVMSIRMVIVCWGLAIAACGLLLHVLLRRSSGTEYVARHFRHEGRPGMDQPEVKEGA